MLVYSSIVRDRTVLYTLCRRSFIYTPKGYKSSPTLRSCCSLTSLTLAMRRTRVPPRRLLRNFMGSEEFLVGLAMFGAARSNMLVEASTATAE
jgi:hypothetical protein